MAMLGPLNHETLKDYHSAFADGELNAAQSLEMWTFLEGHPDRAGLLLRLSEHQKLTAAARRTLHSAAPNDVRKRIVALVENAEKADPDVGPATKLQMPSTSSQSSRRRIGYAFAVAAGLLIGVSATVFLLRSGSSGSVIPGELVSKVGEFHAECSRLPAAMHSATFEAVDAQLATAMKVSLNSTSAVPDLTAAGFNFTGAGPCHGAGVNTVHLLYRAANPRSVSAISLFVQPDVGQYPALDANRVYRVSSPTSPFPTLAWRKDNVIYVLLADNDRTESVVLQTIRPTAPDEIVTVASR